VTRDRNAFDLEAGGLDLHASATLGVVARHGGADYPNDR
jgi:hypothetical protein